MKGLWRVSPARMLRAALYVAHRRWIDEGDGRIRHKDWWVPLHVEKAKGARIILNGDLRIATHLSDCNPVRIQMGPDSTLHIDGDFQLSQGCKILLSRGAHLYIGGADKEALSFTSGNCKIMVERKLHIGKDFACAWNVFITDCDWHSVNERLGQAETYIGDHVWVTCNCSILKGSRLESGCVLANGTVVHRQHFGPNDLVAGNPAATRRKIGPWQC
jgi:acetyltransferase-like isoleucine patch superfamily enzyme